jgi:hypothetical protein
MRRSNPISTLRIVQIKGQIGIAALPAITARVAREELAKVMAEAPAPYTQYVDGAKGAPLDNVRAGGVILFRFNRIGPVFDWIYQELLSRSPVGPDKDGHYRDDHWVFLNGDRIEAPEVETTLLVGAGSEIVIADLRPYARKIESGESVQAPDGVYEVTAIGARKKFPDADIQFTYRGFLVNSQKTLNPNSHRSIVRRTANRSDNRFPCIVLTASA